MSNAYYNENNKKSAAMLRELIKYNLIAPGDVDERSIADVTIQDIKGFTQHHFFAGIGGWSVALRLAGWSDNIPVWTGSCPCQPFSTAGKRKGKNDERHLWPYWFNLIKECRPAIIFGEQVNTAIAHGWWDDVANDLENQGYACGAAVLPACSVGAPHKRDRLWFVGDAECNGSSSQAKPRELRENALEVTEGANFSIKSQRAGSSGNVPIDVADPDSARSQRFRRPIAQSDQKKRKKEAGFAGSSAFQFILCPDGKSRGIKPGIRLLAHGVQHRAPILHALGNAIVPQVAQKFIEAYMEIISDNNLA